MLYNNPEASGLDLAPRAHRARSPRRSREIVAIKECSGDARRIAGARQRRPTLEILVGGDDWALEGFAAGATRLGLRRRRTSRPASACALQERVEAGDLAEARELYAPAAAARAPGHDAEARAVLQGRAGRGRPRRRAGARRRACRSTPPSARCSTPAVAALGRPGRGVRSRRAPSPRSTPTPRACRPGSSPAASPALPGRDDARAQAALRGRARRPAAAAHARAARARRDGGAILQPPTRPDADWGVLFIEVSGCLPMCGHGTIGVATVLVETGMVAVTEPETVIRLDTPGRARRGARGGAATGARAR